MFILLVEDDYLQSDWISSNLKNAFSPLKLELIATEEEFYACLPEISKEPPNVVIIDVMLRWTDPKRDMPPPPREVMEGGYYRAGLRCQKELAKNALTENIPVILYTVLEKIDLEQELDGLAKTITYLRKDSDSSSLTERIRQLCFNT